MGKKRILVYTESYLPSIGGLENNTLLLCESLVLLNCIPTLITPQKNAVHHHQFTVIESSSLYQFYKEIKKNDFVIINGGVSFKIVFPTIFAFKKYSIIYQMATLYNDIRSKNLKTRLLNTARRSLAHIANKNIAVSNYSFLELEKTFGLKKSGLLINPADPSFSFSSINEPSITQSPFKCLFSGRLIEGKGIKLLIDAIHQINEKKELVQLYIIGDGPEKEYVLKESLNSYINYYGPVGNLKMKDWYQKVNLTIIPSSSHIEGSPLVMAESLIMGTPVLVSSQPAMIESIKHEGLIFKTGDVNDLAKKIMLLVNEKNYEQAKKYCKKISINFSYANYINKLSSVLDV